MPDAATPSIADALAALRRGEVIGLPTETVYGLAGDAANPEAVQRIFRLKGRPADHPLIVHLGDASALAHWARDIPAVAYALAARFWPGPLTLILRRAEHVLDLVTGGQDTVGLRVPAHPRALMLLKQFEGGLAAPSANRFGRISPTRASHVRDEFGDAVPIVLDGGECEVGIESTILDLSGAVPRVLRPGGISRRALEAIAGPLAEGADAASPRASGTLKAHYAPRTPLQLVDSTMFEAMASGAAAVVLALRRLPPGAAGLVGGADARRYAHGLYANLRELDARGAPRILIERPPQGADWAAVNDRLARAEAGAGVEDDAP